MHFSWEPITLELKTTFQIAHGASDQRHNVIVHLDEGLGEGAGVPYLGEPQSRILAYLQSFSEQCVDEHFQLETFHDSLPGGSSSARAALDIAMHDLWAKRQGKPLYELLGADVQKMPATSLTIGIDQPQVMAENARKSKWPILKVKLGSEDDEAILRAIRNETQAALRVDANAGWTREVAEVLMPRLAAYQLELLEQPLPVGDIDGLRHLRELNPEVLLFADESIRTMQDILDHVGAVDGVVIKLMKCGGIQPALEMIEVARSVDMQIMLSCMIESSVGVTAAAHLAPLCDFVDLDGPLLIKNDPFLGVTYDGAQLILPSGVGLGVRARI